MAYLENLGPISLLRDYVSKNSCRRCLIVGAGTETYLINRFTDDIIGVNISRKELKKINLKTNLIVCDAQYIPIHRCSIGFIVCKSTLHHIKNPNACLSEMKRVLRKNGEVVLYEPGALNPIAFLGRKFFPTDIHEPSERPFNPIGLRKMLIEHFQVVDEKVFFIFAHIIPILGKKVNFLRSSRLLLSIFNLDALLCKTLLKNFCWIMVFRLRKSNKSFDDGN